MKSKTELYDVYLRSSMVKFKAPYRHLEIISIGSHLPYYLNRQVIFLLDYHKVPRSVFIGMQRSMLDDLDKMMRNSEIAMDVLPSLGGPDNNLVANLMSMLKCGFSPLDDPFIFSCLHAIRSHQLMQLRKKTRIHVRDGAVLMGGIDETGKLPEGCIFIQVRPNGKKSSLNSNVEIDKYEHSFKVLTGPVLVAKHPVVHPGDVRMLLAVDMPELRDKKNMILFSQCGCRPEADKMAGSDLDGDQFAVCWDDRLFLCDGNKDMYNKDVSAEDLSKINHPPMDFVCNKKANEVEKVTDKHLLQHFFNHAKSESLGKISMLWLDHAAINNNSGCDECLELAKLHSIAVDFPKSGVPADVPKKLRLSRDTPRPHWREAKHFGSFQCDSVLGNLYDEVVIESKKEKFRSHAGVAGRKWNSQGQLSCLLKPGTFSHLVDSLKRIYKKDLVDCCGLNFNSADIDDFTEGFINTAIEHKEFYEDGLISLMNRYKIHSEGELLTGCIRKFHKWNKRRQHDMLEEVKRQCRQLRRECRESFLLEIVSICIEDFETKLEIKTKEDYDDIIEHLEEVILCDRKHLMGDSEMNDKLYHFTDAEARNMCIVARKLASAYYFVTYNPHFVAEALGEVNEENEQSIFFSFPWVIADIIAVGIMDRII